MKNLNIVMLGGSGAGKTVYLASLYNKLSIQGNEDHNLFYLDLENWEDKNKLQNIFASVAAPTVNWPDGTRTVKNWQFQCCVKTQCVRTQKKQIYEIFSFNYIDYAGGMISNILDDEQSQGQRQQLEQEIKEASVILGLLDGEKIVKFMNGHPSAAKWINIDLVSILQVMNNSLCPIHFVISKWDYVEAMGFSLKQIKNKLLIIEQFRNLVEASRDRIRLIPVSSVGNGFASFEKTDDGSFRMIKTGQIFVKPYQVELPLAYVMIDVIQNASEKLAKKMEEMNFISKILFQLKSIFINSLTEFMPPETQWMANKVLIKTVKNSSILYKDSLEHVQNKKAALDHLANCFMSIIERSEGSRTTILIKRKKR
ncbi:MAG: hypothetical protein F6K47_38235 [Symploca sp. SIO2E6]|nr:hypothetical protein [Symploca sp. SIO2E6]